MDAVILLVTFTRYSFLHYILFDSFETHSLRRERVPLKHRTRLHITHLNLLFVPHHDDDNNRKFETKPDLSHEWWQSITFLRNTKLNNNKFRWWTSFSITALLHHDQFHWHENENCQFVMKKEPKPKQLNQFIVTGQSRRIMMMMMMGNFFSSSSYVFNIECRVSSYLWGKS